jgi:hypothetical protein
MSKPFNGKAGNRLLPAQMVAAPLLNRLDIRLVA